jgi:hypothetical protein
MGDVYSNAYLTISAAGSSNSAGGLFFSRPSRSYLEIDYGHINVARDGTGHPPKILLSPLDTCQNVEHNLAINMPYDPLSSRGWTFQERVLSPRLVHFAKDQIRFECVQGTVFEEGLRVPRRFLHIKPGGVTEHVEAPGRNEVEDLDEELVELDRWYQVIYRYTARELTYRSDKLPALSGIAASFAARMSVDGSAYAAGIWRGPHMIRSLCWNVFDREPTNTDEYVAPSWSWASIDSSVYPAHFREFNPLARVLECVVDVDAHNPFGRVRGGWLRIEAPIIPVTAPTTGPRRDRVLVFTEDGRDVGKLEHDYRSGLSPERVTQMKLFAMIMASYTGTERYHFVIIVTPADEASSQQGGIPEKVTRLGLVHTNGEYSMTLTPEALDAARNTVTWV